MSNKSTNENIKYQNILLSPNTKEYSESASMKKFDEIVSMQHNVQSQTVGKPWSKLDKITKIKKLSEYVDQYSSTHELTEIKQQQLHKYLRECLDRKKLQRMKDIVYDKENDVIKNIPGLTFNNSAQRFTLKVKEKKDSTLKNLTKVRKPRRTKKQTPIKKVKKDKTNEQSVTEK